MEKCYEGSMPSCVNNHEESRMVSRKPQLYVYCNNAFLEDYSTMETSFSIYQDIFAPPPEVNAQPFDPMKEWWLRNNTMVDNDKEDPSNCSSKNEVWQLYFKKDKIVQNGKCSHNYKINHSMANYNAKIQRYADEQFLKDTIRSFNIKEFESMKLKTRGLVELIFPVHYAIPERQGGLTWIRTRSGITMPSVDGSWLQKMIKSVSNRPYVLNALLLRLAKSLLEAVHFLYNEGIKPYLGDIANQMKRAVADSFWSAAEVAFVCLQCSSLMRLELELRVRGELGWAVYLNKDPKGFEGFIDTHDTNDPFAPIHWRAITTYAVSMMSQKNASLDPDEPTFTGGRYAFAEKLKQEVPLFRKMKLGNIIHLTQLAIYSGVFVYVQRILLPITACPTSTMEFFPQAKQHVNPVCRSRKEALRIMAILVNTRREGLVLAQLKQQFVQRFNKELCPVMFGYKKLQNLLLSSPFSKYYHLYVPKDSPHRTHVISKVYPLPDGATIFEQSKLKYDASKFEAPYEEWDNNYEPDISVEDLPEVVQRAIAPYYNSEPEPVNYVNVEFDFPYNVTSKLLDLDFKHFNLGAIYNNERIGHVTHIPSINARLKDSAIEFEDVTKYFKSPNFNESPSTTSSSLLSPVECW